jgi:hypothetical protein
MGDIDEVPKAVAPPPSASAVAAEPAAKVLPAEAHHSKPAKPVDPSAAILDQQF